MGQKDRSILDTPLRELEKLCQSIEPIQGLNDALSS